jgi:hypothetical protein
MACYSSFNASCLEHESNTFYRSCMCLRRLSEKSSTCKEVDLQQVASLNLPTTRDCQHQLCVLPIGHTGKCSKHYSILVKNEFTDKLVSSIRTAIYSTPGADDYVIKNRSSRLYPIAISKEDEKKIRDKKAVKKKCAISLKDASSSYLLAYAMLDWWTFVLNIEGIQEHLLPTNPLIQSILDMVQLNKNHLVRFYSNRKIFDPEGFTMCVITQSRITLDDFADPERDNRVDIRDTDVQLGHNIPRDDSYVSIRGENLLPMSRRGNLIIGERVFTEDVWIEELKKIVSSYP